MNFDITVTVQNISYLEWMDRVEGFLEKILIYLGTEKCELAVVFCDDAFITPLNEQYRHKEGATDILSFSVEEQGSSSDLQGDLIISLNQMTINCQQFNVTQNEELKRLLIHGILHLAGFDHQTLETDEPMLVKQEEILSQFKDERLLDVYENS